MYFFLFEPKSIMWQQAKPPISLVAYPAEWGCFVVIFYQTPMLTSNWVHPMETALQRSGSSTLLFTLAVWVILIKLNLFFFPPSDADIMFLSIIRFTFQSSFPACDTESNLHHECQETPRMYSERGFSWFSVEIFLPHLLRLMQFSCWLMLKFSGKCTMGPLIMHRETEACDQNYISAHSVSLQCCFWGAAV